MYRDCFLISKEYGNYKNRFSENIDNYMYYCIRNYIHKKNPKERSCGQGYKHTFKSLYNKIRNDFDWLFDNKIPIDLIDLYGQYIDFKQRNDSRASTMDQNFVCVCELYNNLGENCHFLWPFQEMEILTSFEDVLSLNIEVRSAVRSKSLSPPCYNLFDRKCLDSSQKEKCLDWRDICDNVLDCINGEDERRCLELEINSCDSQNEFRCRNGLCIPRAFLFDGDIDCMDGSDEKRSFPDHLCYQFAQFDCEERICSSSSVSCGDGQCIDWVEFISGRKTCINERNLLKIKSNNSVAIDKCDQYPSYFYRCLYSRECISKYKLFDGYYDCSDNSDENITYFKSTIDKSFLHDRYECETVPGMIMLHFLGDGIVQCSDFSDETNTWLNWEIIKCQQATDGGCQLLRKASTWKNNKKGFMVPFHMLCDSVWNMAYGFDEMYCAEGQWVCPRNWKRYNRSGALLWNGNCVPNSQICDNTWNQPDAQDELNCSKISNFLQAAFNWPCENRTTKEKIDILQNQHLLGDGKIDCIGGQDERYTGTCHDGLQIKDRFQCTDKTCISQQLTCDGIQDCSDGEDELSLYCVINQNSSSSIDIKHNCKVPTIDCGDGTCINKEQRCDGEKNCKSTNKDEISCHAQVKHSEEIEEFPSLDSRPIDSYKTWICAYGFFLNIVDVSAPTRQCFCPPSLYGDYCQYQAHRVTVTFTLDIRLDIIKTGLISVRIVTLLQYRNQTVDYMILSYNENQVPLKTKQRFYLFYPWSLLQTIHQALSTDYTVTFYGYGVGKNKVNLLYIWHYPIKFPFLPAYRLVVQLNHRHPLQCSRTMINSCGPHSKQCHMIDEMTYHCECQSPWYGMYCSEWPLINQCANYSQYLPAFRYGFNQSDDFICVCAANQRGRTCHITHELEVYSASYQKDPCFAVIDNNYQVYPHIPHCVCSLNSSDSRCQLDLQTITVSISSDLLHKSSIVLLQTNMWNRESGQLISLLQEFIKNPENKYRFLLPLNLISATTFVKIYKNDKYNYDIFLVYNGLRLYNQFNITIQDRCFRTRELTNLIPLQKQQDQSLQNLMRTFKFYHRPCQYRNISCFYDEYTYFCTCDQQTQSASCALYDFSFEQCNYCFNDGFCIFGNKLKDYNDFVCQCPRCYHGLLCQFRTAQFGYSLEALIASNDDRNQNQTSIISHKPATWKIIYLSITIIMMFIGLLSNCCSYMALHHPQTVRSSITYVLMSICMINQLCLISLVLQIIYVLLNETQLVNNHRINLILCKSIPYAVKTLTFVSKWSIAYASLIRLHKLSNIKLTTIPNRLSLTDKLQLLLYIICMISVFGSTVSEILFHRLIELNDNNEKKIQCAIELSNVWSRIDTSFLFLHNLLPFILNIYSLIMIIRLAAESKSSVEHKDFIISIWTQILKMKKQLICPLFMVCSALPQLIIGFVIDCDQWYNMWLRYLILVLYLLSHIPEILSFVLFIYPSTDYIKSFQQTLIGKWLTQRRRR